MDSDSKGHVKRRPVTRGKALSPVRNRTINPNQIPAGQAWQSYLDFLADALVEIVMGDVSPNTNRSDEETS